MTTQDLIDDLPDTGDIVAGVTTGHDGDHGTIKEIVQALLDTINAIPDGGGGGGGGGGDGTDPDAIHSDGSVTHLVVMSKTTYDGLAPGTAGWLYATKPEA